MKGSLCKLACFALAALSFAPSNAAPLIFSAPDETLYQPERPRANGPQALDEVDFSDMATLPSDSASSSMRRQRIMSRKLADDLQKELNSDSKSKSSKEAASKWAGSKTYNSARDRDSKDSKDSKEPKNSKTSNDSSGSFEDASGVNSRSEYRNDRESRMSPAGLTTGEWWARQNELKWNGVSGIEKSAELKSRGLFSSETREDYLTGPQLNEKPLATRDTATISERRETTLPTVESERRSSILGLENKTDIQFKGGNFQPGRFSPSDPAARLRNTPSPLREAPRFEAKPPQLEIPRRPGI